MNETKPEPDETRLEVSFYMKGGHTITAGPVVKVEMTRHMVEGNYTGYSIQWEDGKEPPFFTLSIPDIIAVTAREWQY